MRISRALSGFLLAGCTLVGLSPLALAQQDGNRPGRGGGGQGGPGGGRMGMGGGMMGRGGPIALLMMKEVREELKLDEDQTKELDVSGKEMREESMALFQNGDNAGGPPDFAKIQERMKEVMPKMLAITSKFESKLEEVLDPNQMDRLLGLVVQRDGARSLSNGMVAARLKITEDQKAKMAELEKSQGEAMRAAMQGGGPRGPEMMEKMQALRKESDEKLSAILSDEQKKSMEAMKGEEFKFQTPQWGGGQGGPGGGRRGRGESGS